MMNELYCLNEMSSKISSMQNCLHCIHEEFLIPLWVIAICAIIFAVVWVVMGVLAGITMVKLQHKMVVENALSAKDYRKTIRKMQRTAKHRINKGGENNEKQNNNL